MTKRGRPSLAGRRHELIVSQIRRTGSARVAELAELLDVSEMTVRRDLDSLDAAGLVVKVHGGAVVRYEHSSDEPGFEAKLALSIDEKRAIAASAAVLTTDGSAIGMTAGTTTVQLAAELVSLRNLTVVTNSIRVADVFHTDDRPDRTVILIGGERTPSDALVGPVAVAALGQFHLDTLFMGVHGVHEHAGFTTPNVLEAETNKAFIAATDDLVVLADHTKWDVTGLRTICPLSTANTIVTDDGLGEHAQSVLRREIRRVVVSVPGSATERSA
jgi:DeoR/GlpR family transcriptional regulator of sugar metabolism